MRDKLIVMALIWVLLLGPTSLVTGDDFPRSYDHFTFNTSWERNLTVENMTEEKVGGHYVFNFSIHDLLFPSIRLKRMAIDSNCLYRNDSWEVTAYVRNKTRHDLYRLDVVDSGSGLLDLPNGNYTLLLRIMINETVVKSDRTLIHTGAVQLSLVDEASGVDEPWYFFVSMFVPPEPPEATDNLEDESQFGDLIWIIVVLTSIGIVWVIWETRRMKGEEDEENEGTDE